MSIFAKHGPTKILDACKEAAQWTFGGWPEGEGIGSSDVSCCVISAIESLGEKSDDVNDAEFSLLRNAVHNAMNDVLDARRGQ